MATTSPLDARSGRAPADRLAGLVARNWWLLLLRGLAAIAFAALLWLQPAISIASLVIVFGAYAFVDGVFGVWGAIAGREKHDDWWVLLLWGLAGIGVGVMTFLVPGLTALALLFYIAVWSVAIGVLQLVAAVRLRKEIEGEWLLGLAGVASIAFGVLLMAQPATGALALLWLIAGYAFAFGVLLVVLAFKVRGLRPAAGAGGAA